MVLLLTALVRLAAAGTNVSVVSIVERFHFQGPLLVACPSSGRKGLKNLPTKQTVAIQDTHELQRRFGESDYLFFNSFLLCGHEFSVNHTSAALRWAKENIQGNRNGWLVTCDSQSCPSLASLDLLTIGDRIFFLDVDTMKFFESYTINGVIEGGSVNQDSFNARRSNLRETHLNVLVEFSYDRMTSASLDTSVITTPSGDLMYLLSEHELQGVFAEVLKQLRAELNFTMTLLRRKDGDWGTANEGENGTTVWTGMLASLQKGEADLVGASLTNTAYRLGG